MSLTEFAEQLTIEWETGPYHPSLAEYILDQLADPESDYSDLLDELCRSRWTAEQVAS